MSALNSVAKAGTGGSYVHQSALSGEVNENANGVNVVRSARTGTEKLVRQIIGTRAERRKFLPAHLFADPAWDMLLDLYLADITCQRISISSLCCASNVPATTALRWITTLKREGLVERMADPYDHRRYFMYLSAKGLDAMDGFFGKPATLGMRA